MDDDLTVETMPLESLRQRVREAQRIVAQAKRIARASFVESKASVGAETAAHEVGILLDAAQKLLPGAPIVHDAPAEVHADDVERAELLESLLSDVAELYGEINENGARSTSLHAPPSRSSTARAL